MNRQAEAAWKRKPQGYTQPKTEAKAGTFLPATLAMGTLELGTLCHSHHPGLPDSSHQSLPACFPSPGLRLGSGSQASAYPMSCPGATSAPRLLRGPNCCTDLVPVPGAQMFASGALLSSRPFVLGIQDKNECSLLQGMLGEHLDPQLGPLRSPKKSLTKLQPQSSAHK